MTDETDLVMMTLAEINELERLRQENAQLKQQISDMYTAAKVVHEAVVKLDSLVCL